MTAIQEPFLKPRSFAINDITRKINLLFHMLRSRESVTNPDYLRTFVPQ
jgi:hypothetical protein